MKRRLGNPQFLCLTKLLRRHPLGGVRKVQSPFRQRLCTELAASRVRPRSRRTCSMPKPARPSCIYCSGELGCEERALVDQRVSAGKSALVADCSAAVNTSLEDLAAPAISPLHHPGARSRYDPAREAASKIAVDGLVA